MKRFTLASGLTALAFAPAAFAATEGHGQDTLLTPFSDPVTHLVMLGILIFFVIIWRVGAFKAVLGGLDSRADAIRKELEEAASLREQAAEALAMAERRQQDADKEAEAIVEQAKLDAKAFLEEAKKDLTDKIARREAQAAARITRAEAEAASEVRRAAADAATEAARRVMADQTGVDQFEAAAQEIEKALR
jgi:F-type H+-transporting ATPase subunit b